MEQGLKQGENTRKKEKSLNLIDKEGYPEKREDEN